MKRAKFETALMSIAAASVALSLGLSGCGKAEWREVAPNTGDPAAEARTGDIAPGTARPGQTAYVVPERLRGRDNPTQNPESSTTLLERGEPVEIVDPNPRGDDRVVAVRVLPPQSIAPPATSRVPVRPAPRVEQEPDPQQEVAPQAPVVFVPLEHLQTHPVQQTPIESEVDRYIVIQNIATEKLRIYEISNVRGEPNKLVMETDMIAGENDPAKTRRTALGSYKILSWHKYYQDHDNLFPSWFDQNLPTLPLPGASLADWKGASDRVMRGAFGWYTAKIGPNAHAQWTHGTLGWGADRDRFIQVSKSQLAQFYSDPRSFGCTRVENQAIAFMNDILPVGTRIIKIYAKEAIADASQSRYKDAQTTAWDWILTNDEVRKVAPRSSNRTAQLLRDVPEDSKLEEGTYMIDMKPDAVAFKKHVKGDRLSAVIIRPEANLYDLPESAFKGEFLVDEGRLVGYKHPKQLRKGGYTDSLLPKAIVK